MSPANVYELEARERKVARLVQTARTARDGRGFTAAEVAAFTPEQWQLLEMAADVRHSSQRTRDAVVDTIAGQEARSHGDPFEGLA